MKEAMDADGKIDAAKLEAWIIKSQIDPNDSDNEVLMSRYLLYPKRIWLELFTILSISHAF